MFRYLRGWGEAISSQLSKVSINQINNNLLQQKFHFGINAAASTTGTTGVFP